MTFINASLNNKRIVILGGSSGIGLATAKAASAAGAHVIIVSSNQQRVDKALELLPSTYKQGYAVNLTNEEQVKAFFNKNGNFDHLVFTAGESLKLGMLPDIDTDEAKAYFNLRYWGAVTAVKYAAPYINAGGSVVLTSGIVAARPNAGWSMGASICAAMEGFTRAMAIELAPVRVNIVSPGFVRTPLWANIPNDEREAMYATIGNTLPVKRVGEADEIAQAYLYLMQQTFGTGQVITVDGGALLV